MGSGLLASTFVAASGLRSGALSAALSSTLISDLSADLPLPYSGALGSQSLFFFSSAASCSAERLAPLFMNETGTLVT